MSQNHARERKQARRPATTNEQPHMRGRGTQPRRTATIARTIPGRGKRQGEQQQQMSQHHARESKQSMRTATETEQTTCEGEETKQGEQQQEREPCQGEGKHTATENEPTP